jgi:hypothetical protein
MKTPILGQSYVVRSLNEATNRLVNMFPEIVPDGGKEPAFFMRAPGLRKLATIGTGPIRGLWTYGGYAYVVSGQTVYKLSTDWTHTSIGTVSGTGPVSMTDNGTQLFIACNGPSYIYNASTSVFAQITDGDFPGASVVGYLDGYFVFIEPNSQRVWVTSLLDGTSIDPLDFASAEGSPDGLVSMIIDHREVWLFGTNSVEVWYDAGLTDFPLQRVQGAFNEIGCAAVYSVAKLDNAIFWLGSDARGNGIVYRANGYTGQRVSTHAIEYAIQGYGSISDAIAYTYQQDGHPFYVLTFPSVEKTWVYDVSTQAWHERAGFANGSFTRHRSNCQTNFNNEVIVGDFEDGRIYAYDLDVYSDDGAIQKWLRSWRALPTGKNDLKRTAHHSLQLDCEAGIGLNGIDPFDDILLQTELELDLLTEIGETLLLDSVTTIGANPLVSLRWSDDGGHTWGNYHTRSMGRIGEFGARVLWRRLGMTQKLRDRVYEVSGTDPVKISIMGAELIASGTNA